jgi:hypothetical protein
MVALLLEALARDAIPIPVEVVGIAGLVALEERLSGSVARKVRAITVFDARLTWS